MQECRSYYYYDPTSDGLPPTSPGSSGSDDLHQTNPGNERDPLNTTGNSEGGSFDNITSNGAPSPPIMKNRTTIYISPFTAMSTVVNVAVDDLYESKDETYRAEVLADIKDKITRSFPISVIPEVTGYFSGLNGVFSSPVKPSSVVTLTIAGRDCGSFDALGTMSDILEPLRSYIRGFFYALSTLYFLSACVSVIKKR